MISIHPPLAGRDTICVKIDGRFIISIHPPLAGRDDFGGELRVGVRISIHPPLAGRDPSRGGAGGRRLLFQSTRPLRGGTTCREPGQTPDDFNPPAPCGAGLPAGSRGKHRMISIHPPLAGRDLEQQAYNRWYNEFQSTRPLRGGTAILHKKTVQNIAYCTKSAFTLAVLSGFLALMRPFFCQTCTNFGANLPKNRCSLPVRTLIPSGPPPADSRH